MWGLIFSLLTWISILYGLKTMCSVGDEWVLLAMLLAQCIGGLPVMALMRLCGIVYAVLYAFGVVVSLNVTFVPRLRAKCCTTYVALVTDYGLCIYLLTHVALLSLASYTLYQFLTPFLKNDDKFSVYCTKHKLYANLSRTACDRLQGFYAVSLVALTIANLASAYLLLLGSRITRHNWLRSEDNERLLKRRGSVV